MSNNKNLHRAHTAKYDEFYTRYEDIEREVEHYVPHFAHKAVYCNCDTAESNFVKYFQNNFNRLKLKDLLYSSDDFRTRTDLLEKADIVVTNPPFSLFHEHILQLVEYKKKFLIIGNINSVAHKPIFPLFKNHQVWLGAWRKDIEFITPNGNKKIKARWYTNMEYQSDIPPLVLTEKYDPAKYPKFDNYDAINVDKTKNIPYDYDGVMGVPLTFLDKYDTTRFELYDVSDRANVWGLKTKKYTLSDAPDYNDLNAGAVLKINGDYKSVYWRIFIKRVPEKFKILGMADYDNESGLRTKIYTKEDVVNPSVLNRGGVLKENDEYRPLYSRILIQRVDTK